MTHHISRRHLLAGASGAGLLGLLAACGNGSSNSGGSDAGQSGGQNSGSGANVFVIGTGVAASNQFPRNFNRYGGGDTGPGLDLVFEPLFRLSSSAGGQLIPVLAESAEHSEDGLDVTYHLRKDVKWSDGTPFTAKDVWFTLGTIYGEPTPDWKEGDPWTWLRDDIEMPDEHTVVVHYRTDQRQQEVNLALYYPIVPEHIHNKTPGKLTFGDAGGFTQDTMEEPVGTGPYVLQRFDSQLVEYKRRDDYWGGTLPVETVQFVPSGQAGNIETQITQGNIDLAEGGAPGVVKGFATMRDTNQYRWIPDGASRGVVFNCIDEKRPTSDVNVRRALRDAVDPVALQDAAGVGYTIPNIVGVDPTLNKDLMKPEFQQPYTQNADGAKKALEESGWSVNGSGNLEKDGKEHPLSIQIQNDNAMDMVVVPVLVAQWEAVLGLKVTFDPKPKDVMDVLLANADFDLTVQGLGYPATPWANYTMYDQPVQPLGEEKNNGNFGRWEWSEEAEEAMAILVSTLNTPETQAEISKGVQGVQQAIFEDAPYAPLYSGGTGTMFTTLNWTGFPEMGDVDFYPRVGGQGNLVQLLMKLQPAS